MTREQIVYRLQQDYALRREENQRLFQEHTEDICAKCPGLRQLLDNRREALMRGLRSGILAGRKDPEANASLPDEMMGFNKKIAAALKKGGLDSVALQPVYTCPLCRDEGYLYEPSRRMCSCFEKELNRRMIDELGLAKVVPQTFERFDEALFTTEPVESYSVSQRQMISYNRNVCLEYADSFPDTAVRDLLFMGKSGLGKTFLLQAIAHRVAGRGFLPLYISAYRLFETARKAYFENDSDQMTRLIDAPLLLMDDLGTEPLMANITITQLFNLLNERQMAGHHTVISTNLTISALKERYTERIASRLLDGRNCMQLTFIGEDVRRRLGNSEDGI
ncbi:MAG: ATP-binding protein [Clostridia bacterium]|nr:ATP-binding protein [Clostridia bacterium]